MDHTTLRTDLNRILPRALAAVDPESAVRTYLETADVDFGNCRKVFLAGIGKAGYPMARAVEELLGERLDSGWIIVKDGHGGRLERIQVFEASHPEPDERGRRAAWEIASNLRTRLRPEDLLIFVISGGGSALFPLPVPQIGLAEKQETTRILIRCGATIQEINTIRKHLSQVKGGRLLDFLNGARVVSMVLSDVVGDDFASIASGPTAPDPSTFQDCLDILVKYRIGSDLPLSVVAYLEAGAKEGPEAPAETPKPGDGRFKTVSNVLVGNNLRALEAAQDEARSLGYQTLVLSSSISGDAREAAGFHMALAREILTSGNPLRRPCCLISGGETTVRVQGKGKGGRNMEFVLHCLEEIRRWKEVPFLIASIGSDGTDGPTDAAGAVATFETVQKAEIRGLSTREFLEKNDSYHFFQTTGDLIITGPTQTNVMDLRFVLIG